METSNKNVENPTDLDLLAVETPTEDGTSSVDFASRNLSQNNDEYNPYMHRNVKHPTSNLTTLIHLLKGLIGTGIFAIPKGFLQVGYLVGSISVIIVGILLTYCLHILLRSQYKLCRRHRVAFLSYSKSMQISFEEGPAFFRRFAPYAPGIVDSFLTINQIGLCCVYIVFVAKNVKAAIDTHYEMDVRYYMLIMLVPLTCLMFVRNLRSLAPFSTIANLAIFYSIGVILSYVFVQTPSINERRPNGLDPIEFPMFFGTTLFAMVAIGVIMSIEHNMKTPQSFVSPFGVLNCGMGFVTLLYSVFGFLCYLKFGDDLKDSVTLNLPDNGLTKSVQLLYSVAITLSYALQCFVAIQVIWTTYLFKYIKNKSLGEFSVRICIVLFTCGLAGVFGGQLGIFISLFGGFCLSMLGIAFPSLMEICVLYPYDLGRYNYILIRNTIIILIAIFVLITSTVKNILELIDTFKSDDVE